MGSNQSKPATKIHNLLDMPIWILYMFDIPNGVSKIFNKSPEINKKNNEIKVNNWKNYFEKNGVKINVSFIMDDNYKYTHRISVQKVCYCRFDNNINHTVIDNFLCSFRDFNITTNLNINNTNLKNLPEKFLQVKLGGSLYLNNNELETLPETFGNLQIGGGLCLSNNRLETLPETFPQIQINGILNLDNNRLHTLPFSFGNITGASTIYLQCNNITSLPKSIEKLKGTFLNLNDNLLTRMPKNF